MYGIQELLTNMRIGHLHVKNLRGVTYMTNTTKLEGINGPVLSINECNARIHNMLSHLYSMQMLQLRMNVMTEELLQLLNMDYLLSEHSQALCRVRLGFEDPLDDDVAIEDETTRVDSDIEYSADDDKAFEMGEDALSPMDNEE
ncbi:hypothetical protein HAX54_051728 [Datura stramonium]|uniref:Uncharacterized protein n=1 Tax=Datura stramonium TaxID=4076 RepID=A0ABS8SY14_DATST|nr:hypothetical protein [Datura stramonium]